MAGAAAKEHPRRQVAPDLTDRGLEQAALLVNGLLPAAAARPCAARSVSAAGPGIAARSFRCFAPPPAPPKASVWLCPAHNNAALAGSGDAVSKGLPSAPGTSRVSFRDWSRQEQSLQPGKPLEFAIEAHQPPAIGNRQGRQMDIGAEPGRDPAASQPLVKHLRACRPAMAGWRWRSGKPATIPCRRSRSSI
jgi:hypothetical protein